MRTSSEDRVSRRATTAAVIAFGLLLAATAAAFALTLPGSTGPGTADLPRVVTARPATPSGTATSAIPAQVPTATAAPSQAPTSAAPVRPPKPQGGSPSTAAGGGGVSSSGDGERGSADNEHEVVRPKLRESDEGSSTGEHTD